jgi:hypothetical protein
MRIVGALKEAVESGAGKARVWARCFFCGQVLPHGDAKLTRYGRVCGPCCADLGDATSN